LIKLIEGLHLGSKLRPLGRVSTCAATITQNKNDSSIILKDIIVIKSQVGIARV